MAGITVAAPSLHLIQRTDIDLTQVPIVNIVTALVDKLPVDADVTVLPGSLEDLTKLNVKGILSCVVDALPVDISLSVLPTTTVPITTIVVTHTTVVVPTEAPRVKRADLDLTQVPITNLITALVDKIPVDASVKVLPGGLQELSNIDLQSILSCVVDKLPIDISLHVAATSSAVPTSTSLP